ncbi:MAG: tetratricopeptide repeat protein [Prochlorotrichaceae cyanobacterium]
MHNEVISDAIAQSCQHLDLELCFQVSQDAPYLNVFLNRSTDGVPDYSTITTLVAKTIAELGLENFTYIAFHSHLIGALTPDWECCVAIHDVVQQPVMFNSSEMVTQEVLPNQSLAWPYASLPSSPEAIVTDPSDLASDDYLNKADFRRYSFVEDLSQDTTHCLEILPKVATALTILHRFPTRGKHRVLPLVGQIFDGDRDVGFNHLPVPVQEWFTYVLTFTEAEIEGARFWFSRYCQDMKSTLWEIKQLLNTAESQADQEPGEYSQDTETDLSVQDSSPPSSCQTLADLDRYRAMFEDCYQQEDYDKAFDILQECDEFLTLQGHYTLRLDLYEKLVSAYQQQDDPANWKYGVSLTSLGNVYYALGEYEKAIEFHQQYLGLARSTEDQKGEAASLGNLGNAYRSIGNYRKAIECFERTLELTKTIGDRKGEANAYGGLGNAYYCLENYGKAIECFEKYLDRAQTISDRQGEANAYAGLGNAYYSLGGYSKALEFQKRHLNLAREIGNRKGEASSLGNLANTYYFLEEYEKAIEFHQQSLDIKRAIGDARGEAASLGNLGNVYEALGDYGKAIEFHQQHLTLARDLSDRRGEANACFNLGLALANANRQEEALQAFRNARELFVNLSIPSLVAQSDNLIQELSQHLSQQKPAKPHFSQRIRQWFS